MKPRAVLLAVAATTVLLATPFAHADPPATPPGQAKRSLPAATTLSTSSPAVISNGTVELGVNPEGHLNGAGVGLLYLPTGADALIPGCLCEGWGVADWASGVTGWASVDYFGISGVAVLRFDATSSTAVSDVQIGSTFEVTQDYHPSVSPNLYEDVVTIRNTSGAPVLPRYRRVMDWDVSPTPFSEYVTVGGGSPLLAFSSDDGFATANPLGGEPSLDATGTFANSGPADHGALFDFDLPELAAGASTTFAIYYGAAGTESAARAALADVGAEVYSLGKPGTVDGLAFGAPNTYAFGFVGSPASAPPVSAEPPTVSGTPVLGGTLTASPGTWSGAPTFAYQWQSCDAALSDCQDVAGATGSSYVPVGDDVGALLRVVVTAANAAGSASATSASVGPVDWSGGAKGGGVTEVAPDCYSGNSDLHSGLVACVEAGSLAGAQALLDTSADASADTTTDTTATPDGSPITGSCTSGDPHNVGCEWTMRVMEISSNAPPKLLTKAHWHGGNSLNGRQVRYSTWLRRTWGEPFENEAITWRCSRGCGGAGPRDVVPPGSTFNDTGYAKLNGKHTVSHNWIITVPQGTASMPFVKFPTFACSKDWTPDACRFPT